MEARVLLCNWCRAKGKSVFATAHIAVVVGGPKGKQFSLDGCESHVRRFARALLVGTTISGRTPKAYRPRGNIAQIAQTILVVLARETAPISTATLLSHKPLDTARTSAKWALRILRKDGLILMHGTRATTRYKITAKGRARVKKNGAPTTKASAPEPQRAARRLRGKRQRHRR